MSNMDTSNKGLWTRDFTIITLGSVISMFGNAMSGFALSLLILDYTGSTLLYSIYIVLFTLPQIIMPVLFGAYMDRFSRRKTIYTLDFISSAIYVLAAFLLASGWFSFPFLAAGVFIVGSISSIYMVAFQSFYPLLITKGYYQKAYSISSVLETLSAVMIPVSAWLYNQFGIAPLLAANAVCFLIAACMETQIKAKEEYIEERKEERDSDDMKKQIFFDIKKGIEYISNDRGLKAIAAYFTVSALFGGCTSVLMLPYFKSTYANGEYIYMIVFGMATLGRALAGSLHYRFSIPVRYKYAIALTVYICTSLFEGVLLFLPLIVMGAFMLMSGMMGVTSYTIRISATQAYVPDGMKGRFNGAFNMLNTVGMLCGEVIAGGLGEITSPKYVILFFGLATAAMAVILIGGSKDSVKKIYNTQQ
ncbi:MAG: MFS transporter [Erysipelotrichaceae bacterium]|nr:MFS transporter [Erysipelotrichaceae bacterium]